ncbi:MAG: M23 family metallopeptidase [candidate division KSB1 bacterium]|nr:M23 family metallopeptidase [candidate division KSB1 bacterium]
MSLARRKINEKNLICLILTTLLTTSCVTYSPFPIGRYHGSAVPYGDFRHAGIDFDIRKGTPIIAASDGDVYYVGDPCPGEWYCGGIFISIYHRGIFTRYGHLKEVYVEFGEKVKRGQLIGLSGANNMGYEHLHFAICNDSGGCPYSKVTIQTNSG